MVKDKRCVFIIGAKSIGNYGGFETFVDKLTEYFSNDEDLKFYVACKKNGQGSKNPTTMKGATIISDDEFSYHNATCFRIKIPEFLGAAQAIYYDIKSFDKVVDIIIKNKIKNPIVYVLACRLGPFFTKYVKKIHELDGKVYVNPDGHEWQRKKWNYFVRKYWKYSEYRMVKQADLVVCDSKCIEEYINYEYSVQNTTFIAYGADIYDSKVELDVWNKFLKDNDLTSRGYYLVVGRMIPENNYETILREFMGSNTSKDLVLICDTNNKFYRYLTKKFNINNDKRIKFIGTIYDKELLKKIRENAFCYIHGHEVGGTNPSLLEALASTQICMAYDVKFNNEVADKGALYWNQRMASLSKLIEEAESMSQDEIDKIGKLAKERISNEYTWDKICNEYEMIFKS